MKEASILQVAELVRGAHVGGVKACVLVGAGVSKTAGIGLAGDFVERIRKGYPQSYAKACEAAETPGNPGYAECMAALPTALQVQLVREDIDRARINWAHIGIARLEAAGVIDTILTPNFDPLASRACAMFNRFPAIYDLAGLRDDANNQINFDRSFVKGSAIFHLHGQHTGFLLLNTADKLQQQADRIRPVLDAAMKGKPIIIAGYSGECDPLVDRIAELAPFNHGLFWVCHDDRDPAANVCEKLLEKENCWVVRNAPGDPFFIELANALEVPAPQCLADPFGHMKDVLGAIAPFDSDGNSPNDLLLTQAQQRLEQAAERFPERSQITQLMADGRYQDVLDIFGTTASPDEADRDLAAWAATELGNVLSDQAERKSGEEGDALFAEAYAKYATALAIKPDMHEALYNWGVALLEQAERKPGEQGDALFAEAYAKYDAALAIKPDKHEALNNWGTALLEQAKRKPGEEGDALFAEAYAKYDAALAIKPDKHEALFNWGVTLSDQAERKPGEQGDALFAEAYAKYDAALAIKPDKHEALFNWGNALSDQAKRKPGGEGDALFAEAYAKYNAALAIKPDKHEALHNWGVTLSDQAERTPGEEGDALFAEAYAKYAAALAIKPDKHEALHNWGVTLSEQAERTPGEEGDALFAEAYAKYAAALAIKPDMHEALFNWGTALSDQAERTPGEEGDALFAEAYMKYAAALAIKPDKHEALNNWGIALSEQAERTPGEEGDVLFAEAYAKYADAFAIKPDMHEALNNWGVALMEQAKRKSGKEAAALFDGAESKFMQAETILPGSAAYNLACLSALQGQAAEAANWLRKSQRTALDFPSCDHITTDTDFDAIRDTPEFQAALADVGCAPPPA
ncbi:hypothetical protein ATE62_15060 [Sphingopyxis sp. HIX]|nr:hypothetical protein ATE62_15060 [Sphingopyxis sp. HIX]KTE83552.1 hypothetical protein ATE72_13325 [Sphingopyxis sp. HXXIV]